MAASIPSQERTVDPFASYNSNTVNDHTKMVTYDEEGMANINSLRVTDALDSTEASVVVSTGFVYKDAVLIQATGQSVVDFNNEDHYYDWDSPGLGFQETGYYYIVMNYVYVKSRPAPQMSYQIIKPSQRGSFSTGGSWLFLAAVLFNTVGPAAPIDGIFDYDPEDLDNKRLYVKSYMGTETFLPDHDQTRDQSRVAYDSTADEFYFGYSDRWRALGKGTGTIVADTSAVDVGDLVYIELTTGVVTKAILTEERKSADGVVIVSDVETGSPPGAIQLIGLVEDVPVEAARIGSVDVGDLVYLSGSEAGKVTDVKTTPIVQLTGRCVVENATTVDILFVRGDVFETNTAISVSTTLSAWTLDSGSYRADVDISEIGLQYNVVTVVDDADDMKIEPQDIEFVSTSITRIWMPDNTHTLHVTVVG